MCVCLRAFVCVRPRLLECYGDSTCAAAVGAFGTAVGAAAAPAGAACSALSAVTRTQPYWQCSIAWRHALPLGPRRAPSAVSSP